MTPYEEELEILDKLAVDKVGEDYADAFKVGYLKRWVLDLGRTIERFKEQVEAEVMENRRLRDSQEIWNPYLADEREEGMRL